MFGVGPFTMVINPVTNTLKIERWLTARTCVVSTNTLTYGLRMSKWKAGVNNRLFRAHLRPVDKSKPSPSQLSAKRYDKSLGSAAKENSKHQRKYYVTNELGMNKCSWCRNTILIMGAAGEICKEQIIVAQQVGHIRRPHTYRDKGLLSMDHPPLNNINIHYDTILKMGRTKRPILNSLGDTLRVLIQ